MIDPNETAPWILAEVATVANAVDPSAGEASESHEVFTKPQAPDFLKGVPEGLWRNLGIPENRRGRLDGKAFYPEAYQVLIIRISRLTEYIVRGLAQYNSDFAETLSGVIRTHAGDDYTGPVLNGVALAIEAYQIESERSLLQGFAGFKPGDAIKAFQDFPVARWWEMTPEQKMLNPMCPNEGDNGFFDDVRQIGLYSLKDDMAVGLGAFHMSNLIVTNWPKIYTPDHPSYEPSRYAAPSGGTPGIR